jgi:hypothetical protein
MQAYAPGLLPATPPRRGLLDIPGVRVGGALLDLDWRHGLTIEPECHTLTLPAEVADLDGDTTDWPYWWTTICGGGTAATEADPGTKAIGDPLPNTTAEAWQAWVGYHCSSLDFRPGSQHHAEIEARLRRRLEACTPSIVEHELWTGHVATLQGADTPSLQEGATELDGGIPLGYVTALAELEQALAACSCSGQHIIHAQPRVVTYWASENLVRSSPDGRYLETAATGAYVAAGSGYPGTDPNNSMGVGYGLSYAYGTGMVAVFLGNADVKTYDAAAVLSATNTMVNLVELRAERDVLAIFDASCCHFGAAVSLTDRLARAGS